MIKKIFNKICHLFYNLDLICQIRGGMSENEIRKDKKQYSKLNQDSRFNLNKHYEFLCKYDKYAKNGNLDESYFVQDIWGARKIFMQKPNVHHDVGSSVSGFIAHLLGMQQKVVLIDIREISNSLNTKFLNMGGGGVTYIQADATNLDNMQSNSIESLSALCSIEHFGLGRYGDPINPHAWEKALKSFQRVLKSGGKLYISVPVGQRDKLCFNAHRVFKPQTIIATLNQMQILEMGYIHHFDVKLCMKFEDNSLKIFQENLKAIPEYNKGGNTGLFEFIKI